MKNNFLKKLWEGIKDLWWDIQFMSKVDLHND